jgi:hypothetical protein
MKTLTIEQNVQRGKRLQQEMRQLFALIVISINCYLLSYSPWCHSSRSKFVWIFKILLFLRR